MTLEPEHAKALAGRLGKLFHWAMQLRTLNCEAASPASLPRRPSYLSKSVVLTTIPSVRVLGTPRLYATAFRSASSTCVGEVVSAIFANRSTAADDRLPRTTIIVGRKTPGALSSGISISNVPSSLSIAVAYHARQHVSHSRAHLVKIVPPFNQAAAAGERAAHQAVDDTPVVFSPRNASPVGPAPLPYVRIAT